MARFPREIGGFLGYARIAVHQKDWAEAVRRWQLIRDEFNHELSYIGMAQAMTGLGRFDEAEAVLSQARARFPTSGEIYAEMARTAQASGDVAEALVRWTRLVERFPLFMYGYFQAAEAMEALGERATANTILIEAIDRFHTESRPLDEFSNLIRRRGDQHAAVEAWSALRQACPFNEQAYIRGADALSQAGRREESEALLAEYRLRFNR
jgi:tetratricopeptide (TPR) repeat protein